MRKGLLITVCLSAMVTANGAWASGVCPENLLSECKYYDCVCEDGVVSRYDSKGDYIQAKYWLNSEGVVVSGEGYYEGGALRSESTYDSRGNVISMKDYDPDLYGYPNELNYFTYTYDENNRKTSETSYRDFNLNSDTNFEDLTPVNNTRWTYNENGKIASEITYYENDYTTPDEKYYTYDADNRLIAETRYYYDRYEDGSSHDLLGLLDEFTFNGEQTVYHYNEDNDGYTKETMMLRATSLC